MKNKKKIGVFAALALAFGIFVAGGIGFANLNQVDAATVENLGILNEYEMGKVFTFPKAQIKVGDDIVSSEYAYLVYPSGKANEVSPCVLDEEGVYTLVYTATVNGKKVTATKEFVVSKQIYKTQLKGSSAYYGSHVDMPAVEGVVVNLVSGDEFIYDQIIDLSDNTKNDELIKIAMPVTAVGSADVGEMVIKFADVYDEENYFAIYVKNVVEYGDWALKQAYIVAGANGQVPGGWEYAPGSYNFHVNNEYGFPVKFSMAGVPYDSTTGYDLLTFAFDAKTKGIYVDNAIYGGGNLVADLDDSDTFLNAWGGFTSGKVRMSVYGVDFKSEAMHVVFSLIDGAVPAQSVTTDVAPVISVDVNESAVPYAIVGKEYGVFKATAFDSHEGVKPVSVNVYYNYGKENQTLCEVIDGKFVAKRAGEYALVYSASDDMGQRAEMVITVQALMTDGLSVELQGQASSGYTGKSIVLFDEVVCSNPSGEVDYTVFVNDQEIEFANGSYSFLPFSDGTYSVKVVVNDYVKQVVVEYDITAKRNITPQIFADVELPKYLIQGEKFTFPQVTGYDFSKGSGKEHLTEIFVKENGGEEKAISGNAYAPTQEGTLEVIYRLNIDGRKVEKKVTTTVVSVFDGDDLHIEKYFKTISGDAVAAGEENSVSLTATTNSTVEFINKVQVKDFYMTFVVDSEYSAAINGINLYFTDVSDSSRQVKFTYSKNNDGSAAFSVNDGTKVNVESSFISDGKNFMLTYSNGRVYGSATVYMLVDKYLNGKEFKGFSGNMAYLTIELDGVVGKSVVHLKNLNRQTLNDADKDRFVPQILTDSIVGDRAINDVIVIKEALAADVLCSSWKFNMSVTAPDGNFMVAKDGTVLNGTDNDPTKSYEVVLSAYGDYYIQYYAVDRFGKEKFIAYYVSVKDTTPPEITIKWAPTTASVGDTVTIGQAVVSDNISEQLTVYITVDMPGGKVVNVTNGSFVASKAGVYTVRYMVFDEAGNYTFKSYTVTVV